jgi:hypothetical protein
MRSLGIAAKCCGGVDGMACTLRRPEKRVREGKRGQRPIHLYLIFEKSNLKNQVQQAGFLTCKN